MNKSKYRIPEVARLRAEGLNQTDIVKRNDLSRPTVSRFINVPRKIPPKEYGHKTWGRRVVSEEEPSEVVEKIVPAVGSHALRFTRRAGHPDAGTVARGDAGQRRF